MYIWLVIKRGTLHMFFKFFLKRSHVHIFPYKNCPLVSRLSTDSKGRFFLNYKLEFFYLWKKRPGVYYKSHYCLSVLSTYTFVLQELVYFIYPLNLCHPPRSYETSTSYLDLRILQRDWSLQREWILVFYRPMNPEEIRYLLEVNLTPD